MSVGTGDYLSRLYTSLFFLNFGMAQPNKGIGILVLWRDRENSIYKHEALVQTTLCQNLSSNMSRQMDSEKIEFSSVLKLILRYRCCQSTQNLQTLTKDIDLKKMIVKT